MTPQEAEIEYQKNFHALREKFRVRVTEKEIKEAGLNAKPGEIICRNPQPVESKDIWYLLSNYYAALQLEVCKLRLYSTGLNISQPIIQRELAKLESFRTIAENLDYDDDREKAKAEYSDMLIYFRLLHGYYENLDLRKGLPYNCLSESSTEARIYGRYFLFYNYLKNLLNPRNYIAEAMAMKSTEARLIDERREAERANERNIFIDADNYSPTLEDFKEDSTIQKLNSSKPEYLKYLRIEKKRYTNSRHYHIKWTESNIGNEHGKIVEFINIEIEAGLSEKSNKQHAPGEPQTLKEIFLNDDAFAEAVKALITIKAIDNNNKNLIGTKLKGVLQVWVKILRTDRQKLEHISDQTLTILLNKHFPGLNISEKTNGKHFRNYNKTASKLYRTKLLAFIR